MTTLVALLVAGIGLLIFAFGGIIARINYEKRGQFVVWLGMPAAFGIAFGPHLSGWSWGVFLHDMASEWGWKAHVAMSIAGIVYFETLKRLDARTTDGTLVPRFTSLSLFVVGLLFIHASVSYMASDYHQHHEAFSVLISAFVAICIWLMLTTEVRWPRAPLRPSTANDSQNASKGNPAGVPTEPRTDQRRL